MLGFVTETAPQALGIIWQTGLLVETPLILEVIIDVPDDTVPVPGPPGVGTLPTAPPVAETKGPKDEVPPAVACPPPPPVPPAPTVTVTGFDNPVR